ncbi:MAG TPA: RDD family protein [Bdellovibrionota bacterium]|nr:RDD family protein [Bdellovibrionota bacterium]
MDRVPPTALAPRSARVAAFLLDATLLFVFQRMGSLMGGITAAMVMTLRGAPTHVVDESIRHGILLGWTFWGLAGWFLDMVVLVGLTGSSVGKWVCGMKVMHSTGAPLGLGGALGRALATIPSGMVLYLGYLWALWDPNFRTWHDMICNTRVVRKNWMPSLVMVLSHDPDPSLAQASDQKQAG